jgi:hypothetical protein
VVCVNAVPVLLQVPVVSVSRHRVCPVVQERGVHLPLTQASAAVHGAEV